MYKVAITGIGIISCIGNNIQTVETGDIFVYAADWASPPRLLEATVIISGSQSGFINMTDQPWGLIEHGIGMFILPPKGISRKVVGLLFLPTSLHTRT